MSHACGINLAFQVFVRKTLREAEPELMDGLIQATKDGDKSKFQALSVSEIWTIGDDDEELKEAEYELKEVS